MEIYAYYFLAYLIEGIALLLYCTDIFTAKRSRIARGAFLFLLYATLSIVFVLGITWVNLLLFFLANFIFIFFFYDINLSGSIFHAALVTSVMGLSELFIVSFFPYITFQFYNSPNYENNYLLMLFFTKIPYLALLYVISHIFCKSKEKKAPTSKELLLLIAVPVASIWILNSLFDICLVHKLTITQNRQVTISAFLLLIINIITWFIYTYTQRKNREFTTLQLQLQRELDATAYYQMLLKQDESQQILIHDIKKHLQSLSILNEQGQQDKIHAYIQQIINSSDLQVAARLCDNEMLNAILGRYSRRCMEEQIDFHADIRSGVVDFIKDEDMTSLFCNLLDNALEAAATYPHSYIELSVHNRPNTPLTIISMINSCRINPFDKNGQLRSRKADTLRHGFGMKSVERMVTKYNGEMTMYYKDEDYTFHTIIMLRDKEKIKHF